jgi:uncharacterized protein (DUF2249 family)/iron-sulfur cluster repair protein YtfE (RIC family)
MNVILATSEADAAAAEAVEQHHAELAGALGARVDSLVTAAARPAADGADAARTALVEWLRRELVPHAEAEEKAMYPAAHDTIEGRLLVTSMIDEHRTITGLVDRITRATDAVRAAAAATALEVMFASHLAKENELILPLLAGDPDVSLAALLNGMHELLGGDTHDETHDAAHGRGSHSCGCGETDEAGYPELDARIVPHAIRHATIFGALDAVQPGKGMVLVAPHDPLPLLAQIEQRAPGRFAVDYLERGPEAWRLQFVHQTA